MANDQTNATSNPAPTLVERAPFDIRKYGYMGLARGGTWCGPERDTPHRWLTVDDVREANAAAGYFFFARDTLKFFRSRIGQDLYQGAGGYYFVTSEQDGHAGARHYSVRQFDPATGRVHTVEGYGDKTQRQAHYAARRLAAGVTVREYVTFAKGRRGGKTRGRGEGETR